MAYGDIVPIPDHRLTIDGDADRWRCNCGTGGLGNDDRDAYELAWSHRDDAVKTLVPTLAPSQIADALRACDTDTAKTAAIELLIRHEHWIGYGYLRDWMRGEWLPDGRLALHIEWWHAASAAGIAWYLVDALDHLDPPYTEMKALKSWSEDAASPPRRIQGSTSELAVLRVALSIGGGRFPVNLADDLASLGNANRGLVLTAIAHLLSHGGNLPMRAGLTWQSYDNA